jgi:microcystin-dependent protein
MSEPFLGEIRMFGGNFAPVDWALCNGQLLSVAENAALFNLIGTTYGGDGVSTFGLPDLRGRFSMHQGNGPGLSSVTIGEQAGAETVTLTSRQIPAHSHTAACAAGGGNAASPSNAFWSTDPQGNTAAYNESGGSSMAAGALGSTGGGLPHDNRQPFLAVNFIISIVGGIFPSEN